MTPRRTQRSPDADPLLRIGDASLQLGISVPTIKQWIYRKKIRSIQTAGGHHRIPQSEVDRYLYRTVERQKRNVST